MSHQLFGPGVRRDAALHIERPARPAARRLSRSVSMCIVNWHCRELLRACLRSLVNVVAPGGGSDETCLEIIVADNGSTDGAADMVAREFPRVQLIRNLANSGFAKANNQAAAAAHGEYLFFLNNDTEVTGEAIDTLLDYLEANPDAILVGPRLRGRDGRPQISHRRKPTVATFLHRTWLGRWGGLFRGGYREYRRRTLAANVPTDVDVLMGAALMMRRADFDNLGGWDEDFAFGGEDMELCHRAWHKGRVVYCPQAEIVHQGSVSTQANVAFATPRIAAGFVQYFRKTGATPRELFWYKLLVTFDAPLQLVARSVQGLLRFATGRTRQARKSWNAVKGTLAFLTRGLGAFWRA